MLDGFQVIIVQWVLAGLALGFVLLRVYARVAKADNKHNLGDFIILAAWLSFATSCALYTALWKLGALQANAGWSTSKDLTTLVTDHARDVIALKIIYSSVLVYVTDIWLVKAAILTFYYLITPRALPTYRFVLNYITCFTAITYVAVISFNAFWCSPISSNWSMDAQSLCTAGKSLPAFFVTSCCHIITDLMIICFPFPLLQHSSLHRRGMYGVVFIFALGGLSIAATLARLTVIARSPTLPELAVWASVENATGIMVACTPSLRILLLHNKNPYPKLVDPEAGEAELPSTIGSRPTRVQHRRIPTLAFQSDIWDGTYETAPDWIKMASSPATSSVRAHRETQSTIEWNGNAESLRPPGRARTKEFFDDAQSFVRSSFGSFSDSVPTMPSIRLKAGGIVEHISPVSMVGSIYSHSRHNSSWMELPDPPFLTAERGNKPHSLKSSRSTRDITSMFLDVEDKRGSHSSQLSERPRRSLLGFANHIHYGASDDGRMSIGRIVDSYASSTSPRSANSPHEFLPPSPRSPTSPRTLHRSSGFVYV